MNETSREFNRRQRTAWVVLSGSFVVFCLIAIAVPLLANLYLQNATRLLTVFVQANQGTVGIDDPAGGRRAVLLGEPGLLVEPGARIRTDNTAAAVILVTPPNDNETLARLQVYSNTNFELFQGIAPRFAISDNPLELVLYLESGRLRLSIPDQGERPFQTTVQTPQGDIQFNHPGQYYLVVTNQETQLTVQDGRATVVAGGSSLLLQADQRGIITNNQLVEGPLDTERNLMENGDFADAFTNWERFTWNVELSEQPEGITQVEEIAGEPALRFARTGVGHADVKVRQLINEDVTDYQSIQLLLTFRIVSQSLGVCGVNGSECPLFIRVNYIDDTGARRSWRQGFYAQGEVVTGQTPDACTTCVGAIAQRTHDRVPMQQVVFYEVDLRNELARLGAWPPRFIESVTLEASGHSFEVEVLNVDLIVDLVGERVAN